MGRHTTLENQPIEVSLGSDVGAHVRCGRYNFVDASVWGVDSYDDWADIVESLRVAGIPLRQSPASSALSGLIHRLGTDEFFAPTPLQDEIGKSCGALVQAYRYGVYGDVSIYDMRAAYPSIALEGVPTRYWGTFKKRRNIPGWKWFVRARVTIDTDWSPVIYRFGNRVWFPVGTWECILTDDQIVRILHLGGKVEPIEFYAFACSSIIPEYLRVLLSLRESGSQWAKRAANGLIGKFGSSGRRYVWQCGSFKELRVVDHKGYSYQPQIPAWIHTQQRTIMSVVCERFSALWVDTDGIATQRTMDCARQRPGTWRALERGAKHAILGSRAYFSTGRGTSVSGFSREHESIDDFVISAWDGVLCSERAQDQVGANLLDRHTIADGHTRPWSIAEIHEGAPWQDARRARVERVHFLLER